MKSRFKPWLFVIAHNIILSWQKARWRDDSQHGSAKSERPKNIKLQIRVDKQTLDDLDDCIRREKSNRSEIIRKGIKLVKAEQNEKE